MIVSFDLPQLVVVSDFRMFIVLDALVVVLSVFLEKFSLGSSVSPSILGCLVVGIIVLFMCKDS